MYKIVDSSEFINIINEGIFEDKTLNINFNDEIGSIEYIGERQTYDINIEGNDHFFYANDILTHNSATGNNLDIKNVNNDSVSDSIGTVQTADFIMFLLQNEEMKEQNIMTCKCTKNRFTGRTDYWDMNIDYNKMRFSDVVVNPSDIGASPIGMKEEEINTTLKTITTNDIKIIQQKDQEIKEDFDVLAELGLS